MCEKPNLFKKFDIHWYRYQYLVLEAKVAVNDNDTNSITHPRTAIPIQVKLSGPQRYQYYFWWLPSTVLILLSRSQQYWYRYGYQVSEAKKYNHIWYHWILVFFLNQTDMVTRIINWASVILIQILYRQLGISDIDTDTSIVSWSSAIPIPILSLKSQNISQRYQYQ